VDEVRKPKLIRRQVNLLRLRRGPKTLACYNPAVCFSVISNVAVCEGRKEARQTAENNKNGGEVLVDGFAVAIVGQDRAEELVQEDSAGREELDEVANS
jgi:hypothetical protein